MTMYWFPGKGKALLIVGEQGSGKSLVAIALAAAAGKFERTSLDELKSKFGLGNLMSTDPATIIVEELSPNEFNVEDIEDLVSSSSVIVNRKHKDPVVVGTPNFIFCTGKKDALSLGVDERRFAILEIK